MVASQTDSVLDSWSAIEIPPSFNSVAEFKAMHARLLRRIDAKTMDPGFLAAVRDFIVRAVTIGATLDSPEDRTSIQGLIDYWASYYGGEARKARDANDAQSLEPLSVSETLLVPFDSETLRRVAARAEQWSSTLDDDDARIARRIMLRLVRLSPKQPAFELAPGSRVAMYDIDQSSERVDAMLDRLAQLGVIRIKAGDTRESDQIWLRHSELETTWPTLANWLNSRLSFRNQVDDWNSRGRPKNALIKENELDEARSYLDRNELERAFTESSRYQELRHIERNRARMWWLGGLAIAAAVVAYYAICRALEAKAAGDKERIAHEASEWSASAQSISTLAVASLMMTEDPLEVHSAKKLLIVQSLRNLLFAQDDESKQVAKDAWRDFEAQLCEDGKPSFLWFRVFLRGEPSTGSNAKPRNKELALILAAQKPSPDAIRALQTITVDLKKYIVIDETRPIIERMKPKVMQLAHKVADQIAIEAERRSDLKRIEPYRMAFWRLNTALIIVDDENRRKTFADALASWEEMGGLPSKEIVESLKRGAKQFGSNPPD